MRLLILNAGSSSLKYSVIDATDEHDERVWTAGQASEGQSVRDVVDEVKLRLPVGPGAGIDVPHGLFPTSTGGAPS
jgi:hypothetical protein